MLNQQLFIATDAPAGSSSPKWYTSAWLTVPDELRRDELQILVHGAMSDHRYWDWPVSPERYSYVKWAAERGIATLAIDRVGSGVSSRPPGRELGVSEHAFTLAALVKAVRGGEQGLPRFDRVVLMGCSLGAVVSGLTAATYDCVDAVVLSSYLPRDDDSDAQAVLDGLFIPAVVAQPRLQGLVDDDYLCPLPDLPSDMMYRANQFDAAVLAADEQFLGTVTRAEFLTSADAAAPIREVSAPTLVVMGQYDFLFMNHEAGTDCHEAVAQIAETLKSNFEFEVIPDTGHVVNLHHSSGETFGRIDRWLDARYAEPSSRR
jgi:pimeloyl-ACP methyl ester carboxylesterase